MCKLTEEHIKRLVEIDRLQGGIGSDVEEFIRSLDPGDGVDHMTDPRERLAKRLWDRGFGRDPEVKARNFRAYLKGIPPIPEGLIAYNYKFPFLSLADPRPGLIRVCRLLGVWFEEFGYTDNSAKPYSKWITLPEGPFWFRHDDVWWNRRDSPDFYRELVTDSVLVGSAMEGLFAYAHHPGIFEGGAHSIDLPATVNRADRLLCATLGVVMDQVQLRLDRQSRFPGGKSGTLHLLRK